MKDDSSFWDLVWVEACEHQKRVLDTLTELSSANKAWLDMALVISKELVRLRALCEEHGIDWHRSAAESDDEP